MSPHDHRSAAGLGGLSKSVISRVIFRVTGFRI